MLNNIILVGRVVKLPNPLDNIIYINVTRNKKNPITDVYDTDCFHIHVSDEIRNNIVDYVEIGDMIGVKGHLETTQDDLFDEIKIICDRLTFLSHSRSTNNMGKGEI